MSRVLGAKKISFWSVLGASRERIYERAAGPGQESACSLPTHLALGLKAGLPPCRPLRGVQRLGHGPRPRAGARQPAPDPRHPPCTKGPGVQAGGASCANACGRPAPIWAGSCATRPPCLSCSPFPSAASVASAGLCGLTAGKGQLPAQPAPPQGCFHVSDCFSPPRVAKQLMKKPLSFAFLF